MKRILIIAITTGISSASFAVPRNMYLASPQKIEVSGNKVNLSFELPCNNEFPDEWAGNLVAVSDDEGDMAVALGVVLSKDSCKAGPIKTYTFEYDLKKTGLSAQDLERGASFEPINVAK